MLQLFESERFLPDQMSPSDRDAPLTMIGANLDARVGQRHGSNRRVPVFKEEVSP